MLEEMNKRPPLFFALKLYSNIFSCCKIRLLKRQPIPEVITLDHRKFSRINFSRKKNFSRKTKVKVAIYFRTLAKPEILIGGPKMENFYDIILVT